MEVSELSTKDEILPGGNSFNHDGAVVPSWTGEVVVDVRIRPFTSGKIEDFDLVEYRLVVPSTIGVQFLFMDENGVSTSSWRRKLESDVDLNLLPLLGLKIVGEDIIKARPLIEKSTMTSIDVDLVFVEATSSICTGRGTSNCGFLVFLNGLVTLGACPGVVFCIEEPGVIQAHFRRLMTSKNEHFVILRRDNFGYVLATCRRNFITTGALFFPNPLVTHHAEGVDLLVGLDGLSLFHSFDTTVHDVLLVTDVVERVTRTGGWLVTCLLLQLQIGRAHV